MEVSVSPNPVQFKHCTHIHVINSPQCVFIWSRVLRSSTCLSQPSPAVGLGKTDNDNV